MKKLIKSGICGIYDQCTNALFTEERVNHCGWKEKKKKNWGNADTVLISAIQTSTNYLLMKLLHDHYFLSLRENIN